MKIPLTQSYHALVDRRDYKHLSQYSWCVDKRPNGLCYANTTIGRRTYRMHQLIFPDIQPECDHHNRNGLDNRRCNLRPATRAQNGHNIGKISKPNLSSRYKGVTRLRRLTKRPWQCRLGNVHLGYFASEREAAAVYDRAAQMQRGEFARLNGIDVAIKANHLYRVVSKTFVLRPVPRHAKARVLEYVLACGHMYSIQGYKAPKIGKVSHCSVCTKAS